VANLAPRSSVDEFADWAASATAPPEESREEATDSRRRAGFVRLGRGVLSPLAGGVLLRRLRTDLRQDSPWHQNWSATVAPWRGTGTHAWYTQSRKAFCGRLRLTVPPKQTILVLATQRRHATDPKLLVGIGEAMRPLLKSFFYFSGRYVAILSVLPLPWRLRVVWYCLVGRLVKCTLGLIPQTYAMLADDGIRYDMGKKRTGQAQSIMAMELVVAELERRQMPIAHVREAFEALRKAGTPADEIPYGLAKALFDAETRRRLFRHMKAL
jgi:hypothetical protein